MLDARPAIATRGLLVTMTPAAALERVYVAYRDPVVRYLRGITSSEDEAFELAATVFERAFVALVRDPGLDLSLAWLLRTARNAVIDQARRRKVRLLAVGSLPTSGRHEPDPESNYLEREQSLAIRAALARLPSETRDAIVLRYAVGLTAKAIGEVIGRKEDATQKLIVRGLARLRESLDVPG
jgi:RNA polymerase sigma factor (sigma-70 family)